MEVNPERGEVAILLDGKAYPMRPSYKAMVAIERATGATILGLSFRLALPRDGLTLEEMAIIITEGVRAAGEERNDPMLKGFSTERVGELLFDGGILAAAAPIEAFLRNAITGGGSAKKNQPVSASGEPPQQTIESPIAG